MTKLLRIDSCEELKNNLYHLKQLSNVGLLNFSFIDDITTIKDGTRYKYQSTKFHTCREISCLMFRSLLNELHCDGLYLKTLPNMLRIMFSTNSNYFSKEYSKNSLFLAKKIINEFEKYMEIEPSIISTVKPTYTLTDTNHWLVTASKTWLEIPQLLSLFILIFRFCFYQTQFTESIINDENLTIDNILNKISIYVSGNNRIDTNVINYNYKVHHYQVNLDLDHMHIIIKDLKTFCKQYKNIFEGPKINYYPIYDKDGFFGYGGITSLFQKKTGNAALNKRFQHYVLNKCESKIND